ncbi:MAG TPA: glycine betaine ABC transporter substrate-binding protein, partial [Thermoanaerobaculia bacterium]|nr:glycine betaine ABC transporter substrate-binding protein [Thermoanaerobaculia bacterium]
RIPCLALSTFLFLLIPALALAAEGRVVVGSKNFEESRLLGEMFAQLVESRTGLEVERRLGLAGTQVCFEALRTGAIDVYPEYTGTGLVTILGEQPKGNSTVTLNRVRRRFLEQWDLWWLAPLGFENAFEVAVPRELARREHIETISDLARVAPRLRGGFGHEFVGREDGLLGLQKTYGLRFGSVQPMQHALKYQAAGSRAIDALDVYTTDGRLVLYNLQVLRDDRGFFPPYDAAALVRGATMREHPEVGAVLGLLSGALDEETMRRLNFRLQEGKESEAAVARDALRSLGLLEGGGQAAEPVHRRPGLLRYLWEERSTVARRTLEHLGLCAAALALGVLIAVPLGLWLERRRRMAEPAIRALGLTQTIPSLALLAFMVPFLGIGTLPAVVALWIYSLFPIVRNTYTGVREADPRAVEAATALGMTPGQVLRRIRLPLAAPVLMAGIRTAAVITVGTATLAAFIGAGGLGEPIVTGLQLADTGMILSGAIPAAVLALLVDVALGRVEKALRPPGLVTER